MKNFKNLSLFVAIILTFSTALGSFGLPVFAYEKSNVNFEQARTKTISNNSGNNLNKLNSISSQNKSLFSSSSINTKEKIGLEKSQQTEVKKDYVQGEILVKYKNNKINLNTTSGRTTALNFTRAKSLEKKEDLRQNNISVLRIKDGKTVEQKIVELKNDPNVEYAQPNFQYYLSDITTNDTNRALLWGLDNTGQTINGSFGNITGTNDKDIDAPEAWAINEGANASIIVAVIDSGVAYNHPDLINNMWDGSSCKDENGAALGGCNHGYDYGDNDKTPLPTYSSHGTHIAGTIAATKNNSKGIIGVAPQAKIMALKSSLTTADNVKSINFAAQNGAKIINASWGCYASDQGGISAVCGGSSNFNDTALKNSIESFSGLFITAAGNGDGDADGNDGDNHDSGQTLHMYPCDLTSSNIICVTATDQQDNIVTWADYGAISVDVGAPGTNIYSTVSGLTIDGTSLLNETFDNLTPPAVPSSWVKGGTNNKWATYTLDSGTFWGKVLYGQVPSFPYDNNADTSITSPTYNLSAGQANIDFWAKCDTEYITDGWADYMQLEYSADGVNFSPATDPYFGGEFRWDEPTFDILNGDPLDSTSGALFHYSKILIPSQYLTSNFKFRFHWVSNGSDNNYDGCLVDDVKITKFSDGSDEGYDYSDGTSMAAPHVAGLAALIEGYKPNLTSAEVKNIILTTGDSVTSLSGKTVSGKRIDAFNALKTLSETQVSGNITQDTTWALADSPYVVAGTVQVLDGAKLTIEPGVIIKFNKNTGLNVDGELVANGTSDAMIKFTSNQSSPKASDWLGIYFSDNSKGAVFSGGGDYLSGSMIKYSIIEYGGAGTNGGIRAYPSSFKLFLSNSIIRDNNEIGISLQGSNSKILNNTISNHSAYGLIIGSSNNEVSGNTFTNNPQSGITLSGHNNTLSDNTITGSSHDKALVLDGAYSNTISGNTISQSLVGIELNNNSHDNTISSNLVKNNVYSAVYIGSGSNNQVLRNTLENNGDGITFYPPTTIKYNNIKNNSVGILGPSTTGYEVANNNIYGNTSYNFKVNTGGTVQNINVLNNWWGTTNMSEIDSKIYDYYDDVSLGKVVYEPFLTTEFDSTAKAITAFSFATPATTGVVNETDHTIALTVPFNTDVTALVSTFTITGASVAVGATPQVSSTTPNNFTSPVTYTVTAADSSTQAYVVTVTVAPATNFTISGTIKYYDGIKAVPNTTVTLETSTGAQVATTTTDTNGAYQFTGVTGGGNYVVRVSKDDSFSSNGVSVSDLIAIKKQTLGTELTDIYKKIAADFNSSLSITVSDLIMLKKFTLERVDGRPASSWKFYSSNATLTVTNYLTVGLTRTYNNLTADTPSQDFIGIKMGDVNNSWVNN